MDVAAETSEQPILTHVTHWPAFHVAVAKPVWAPQRAVLIVTHDVERVLADIDADYRNHSPCSRWHGVLLVSAPLHSLSLAGHEHSRTIPLAEVAPVGRVGLLADMVLPLTGSGNGGQIMPTITLARTATNPQLSYKSAVERAIARAEARSYEDHDTILQILDRMADGSNMPEDHNRLAQLVNKYGPAMK